MNSSFVTRNDIQLISEIFVMFVIILINDDGERGNERQGKWRLATGATSNTKSRV